MRSIRLLKKRLEESDVYFTDSIHTALWLLPDGTMLDGEFDGGMRGQDHRIIFAGVDNYGDYYESSNPMQTHWNRIHKEYKVIRLCPESNVALIKKYQRLTEEQEAILSSSPYEIEAY